MVRPRGHGVRGRRPERAAGRLDRLPHRRDRVARPRLTAVFRYGIEHELALLHADGRFADFTDLTYPQLQAVVDALPVDAADYPELHIGDQGIKHKRWYVEGYERFDETGALVRYDPKGMEIRTRVHDSVESALAALRVDIDLLDAGLAAIDLRTTVISFHPSRTDYPMVPELNAWERASHTTPEDRSDHRHMLTYGPDLNLSTDEITDPVDAGRKLTHYSPWLVPLSFSSPFRDGGPWGGLSARTFQRTGVRPAVLVYLDEAAELTVSDPSLTRHARTPAEVGRIEFKAFDACPDPTLYGELLSLLTGLALDDTLPGRRTTPDTALHQKVACTGLADDDVHAGTGELLTAA
ncbi:MAG: hypothetical protein H7Y15_13715, partial [Pseudonocardia sp.]|nr:hypothetical protein [Pseudonocardia sp.]